MRYVVLMLHAGLKPYSQIIDINFPGGYVLEVLSLKTFGNGPHGLRLYDGALCLIICLSMASLAGRDWRSRVAGVSAGLFFTLIHLRDGVVQAGQRDLAMAAILLVALAVLLGDSADAPSSSRVFLFEFLIGATLTVKPVLLLMAFLPIVDRHLSARLRQRPLLNLLYGTACLLLPPALAAGWLLSRGSLQAFRSTLRLVSLSHAPLAHKSLPFLLVHSISPVGAVVALAIVASLGAMRAQAYWKPIALSLGATLFAFVIQEKGFPYQRYPFLALAMFASFQAVNNALSSGKAQRLFAGSALVLATLGLAPRFAQNVRSYESSAPFESELSSDLYRLGAQPSEVQCMDTVGGCIATLDHLGLTQSTGFFYDCYAYVGPVAVRDAYRAAFLRALELEKPKFIVLTSQYCLEAKGNLERTKKWAALQDFLLSNYSVGDHWRSTTDLKWWNQVETPPSYEILIAKRRAPTQSFLPAPENTETSPRTNTSSGNFSQAGLRTMIPFAIRASRLGLTLPQIHPFISTSAESADHSGILRPSIPPLTNVQVNFQILDSHVPLP